MMEIVCIVCPSGCNLLIDKDNNVTGAKCSRGKKFAIDEIICPKRTICSLVETIFDDFPVLAVRTSQEIPKHKIPELMNIIKGIKISKRVKRGEILVANLFGTPTNLISSSSMLYTYGK